MLYIPNSYIRDWASRFTDNPTVQQADSTTLRQMMGIHPSNPIPICPLGFLILEHQHIYSVVIDYQSSVTYSFGRHRHSLDSPGTSPTTAALSEITEDVLDDWEEWNGPLYWKVLAECLGWPVQSPDMVSNLGVSWFWVSAACCTLIWP
jgi:hypothetical protein